MDLLHPTGSQLHAAREVIHPLVAEQRAVHKGRFDHALLPLRRLEQRLREPSARHGHGQRRRARAVFRLDDFVAAKLYAVDEIVELFAAQFIPALAQQGHDRRAAVAPDHGDVLVGRVGALVLADEAGCSDHVQGGDAEEARWVVGAG